MKKIRLVDGDRYWLGAIWAIYEAEDDVFIVGNTFIPRHETTYADIDQRLIDARALEAANAKWEAKMSRLSGGGY